MGFPVQHCLSLEGKLQYRLQPVARLWDQGLCSRCRTARGWSYRSCGCPHLRAIYAQCAALAVRHLTVCSSLSLAASV